MTYVVFTMLFLIAIAFCLLIVISAYKDHKKASGGVVNHDQNMRAFVYKIGRSADEIIALLSVGNEFDELAFEFDVEGGTVKISEYGSFLEYNYRIQEHDGFSILKLEQAKLFGMKSIVYLKLNQFMVGKLQAEIVPFSQYDF